MIRDYFRVLIVDLATGRGSVANLEGRDAFAGGGEEGSGRESAP